MPMHVDLSTEASLSTIVTDAFKKAVKQNLGFDPETPDDQIPVNIDDLLHQAISVCEKEQWRFILRKSVSLTLPLQAFANRDRLCFLPFGTVNTLSGFSYLKTDGTTANILGGFSILSHEPSKLWSENWDTVLSNCNEEHPYPITVTYTTGYASHSVVPRPTIRAIMILAYHFFEYRDAVSDGQMLNLPQGYQQLRDLNLLNDQRAIKYITEDWSKVSRG